MSTSECIRVCKQHQFCQRNFAHALPSSGRARISKYPLHGTPRIIRLADGIDARVPQGVRRISPQCARGTAGLFLQRCQGLSTDGSAVTCSGFTIVINPVQHPAVLRGTHRYRVTSDAARRLCVRTGLQRQHAVGAGVGALGEKVGKHALRHG